MCVTAMLFSTGLGTPTGNPVAPGLKVASNSELSGRMPDIIDNDAGGIVTADESIEEVGQRFAVGIGVDEHHRAPRVDRGGEEGVHPFES